MLCRRCQFFRYSSLLRYCVRIVAMEYVVYLSTIFLVALVVEEVQLSPYTSKCLPISNFKLCSPSTLTWCTSWTNGYRSCRPATLVSGGERYPRCSLCFAKHPIPYMSMARWLMKKCTTITWLSLKERSLTAVSPLWKVNLKLLLVWISF